MAVSLRDRAGRLANLGGAAVSLSLMLGVGVWGYQLVMRDVTGIPVVRAVTGDMRVAPENPGGDVAQHRGLAVNTVAAVGEAAPPEDRLMLAPRNEGLTDEDLATQPMAEAGEVRALDPDTTEVAAALPADDAIAEPPRRMNATEILALADRIAAGADPITATLDDTTVAPLVTLDGAEIDTAPDTAPDVVSPTDAVALALAEALAGDDGADANPVDATLMTASLRPMARPTAQPVSDAASAPVVADTTDASVTPAAALLQGGDALPIGTKLVQLGAFPTTDAAQSEWTKLNRRFAQFMDGKEPLIQLASSNGADFYRLRLSGFEDLGDAKRFCAALDAGRAPCVPVIVR